jgi:glycosyltransferase involved in cell wall biosynthesis
MKILMVSLLKRPVTPVITASRPRVIHDIASGLIAKGHDVTILATQDTEVPGATIIPAVPESLLKHGPYENEFYAHTAMLTTLACKLREIGNNYDIIHNHTYPEFINLLVAGDIKTPIVTTIHGQPFEEFDEAFSHFDKSSYLVAISEAHKKLFKKTNIFRVVYNGINTNLYTFEQKKDDYLLWLGRLSKAKNSDGSFQDPKGVEWAIKLAQATNSRLLLSGNVEDMDFYNTAVKPHLNEKIQWIGPVSAEHSLTKEEVSRLMQKAKCFLMTINWYEPFGLVMAEAMACGTPVIGFDRGAVKEVIADSKTGFVVPPEQGLEGLIEAFKKIASINPQDCRDHVINHFSTETMVAGYEKVYSDILQKN